MTELSYQDHDWMERNGIWDRLEEKATIKRITSSVQGAWRRLQDAVAEPDVTKSAEMTREGLTRLREAARELPEVVTDEQRELLEPLARTVGMPGFQRAGKTLREAVADGDLSLAGLDELRECRSLSLFAKLGLDEEDLS